MTQERFLKILENPDLLASISYEELKTLALAYPYSHNLRYLLAIKARQDDHPDAARNLSTAAAYSLDRTRLFSLIAPKNLIPQPVLPKTEELVLELKPIETIQRELEAKTPIPRLVETPSVSDAQEMSQQVLQTLTEPEQEAALDLGGILVEPVLKIEKQETPVIQPQNQIESPVPEVAVPDKISTPILFIPSFAVWVNQFNPPNLNSEKTQAADTKLKPPVAPKTAAALHEEETYQTVSTGSALSLAEKSVTENKDILSETLARLYAAQGYREKAISMYQRLCLAFPEKSAKFAAEIEKLKK